MWLQKLESYDRSIYEQQAILPSTEILWCFRLGRWVATKSIRCVCVRSLIELVSKREKTQGVRSPRYILSQKEQDNSSSFKR